MEGWRCPGCGRCYSPSMTQCGYCGPGAIKYGTGLSGDTGNQSLSSCPNCGMLIVGDRVHSCNGFFGLTNLGSDGNGLATNVVAVMYTAGTEGLIDPAWFPIDTQNRPAPGDSGQS